MEGIVIKEFQEFIAKGNVIDLAVGIIIGGAFALIVLAAASLPALAAARTPSGVRSGARCSISAATPLT
jgi:hypothetical protein